MENKTLRPYKCSLDGENWTRFVAVSRGQAKQDYLRELDYGWPTKEIYLKIKCRVDGTFTEWLYNLPTTQAYRDFAKRRNIEFSYCGMKVNVSGKNGIIVGHNSSSNLDVFYPEGEYKGQTHNCHPWWETTYYDNEGNIVKDYKKQT